MYSRHLSPGIIDRLFFFICRNIFNRGGKHAKMFIFAGFGHLLSCDRTASVCFASAALSGLIFFCPAPAYANLCGSVILMSGIQDAIAEKLWWYNRFVMVDVMVLWILSVNSKSQHRLYSSFKHIPRNPCTSSRRRPLVIDGDRCCNEAGYLRSNSGCL